MQTFLPFRQIPPEFRPGQQVTVVEAALSGVQAYIFSDQSIYGSGDLLSAKSAYIQNLTQKLDRLLCGHFAPGMYKTLSCSSGKVIAAVCGRMDVARFRCFADDLQLDIFSITRGTLQLNWATAKATVCTLQQLPPQALTVSQKLMEDVGAAKYRAENLLRSAPRQSSLYGLSLEQLAEVKRSRIPTEDCVAIKLDLDNLGAFCSSLTAFDVHNAASQALDRVISGCSCRVVYAGGDDVFAIAPLSEALRTIADMYQKIWIGVNNDPRLQPYVPHFSISGGAVPIPFANGKVPAAYYFSESEEMLKKAKKTKNCICIAGLLYSWRDIVKIAGLFEKHLPLLRKQIGDRFMQDYYLDPKQITHKLAQLGLLR